MEKKKTGMYWPKVTIIILNYNSYEDTLECLDSMKKVDYENYRIIVVDNGSTDGSAEVLAEKCLRNDMLFIRSEINLGYAGGNNLGVARAIEEKTEYICILNNDVEVDSSFLKILISFMEKNPTTGVCGPMICEYDARDIIQSSGAMINYWIGEVPILNNGRRVQEVEGSLIECDYVGGACMLFRRAAILENGYIPEIYFLFYEETEWCARLKKKGYRVVCNCNAKVYHKGSVTVSKMEGMQERYMRRNRILFERRNADPLRKIFFYIHIMCAVCVKAVIAPADRRYFKYYLEGMRMEKE